MPPKSSAKSDPDGLAVTVTVRHPRLRGAKTAGGALALLDAHRDQFTTGPSPREISLVFLTDPELAELHARFLDDPSPTDVITFPGQSAEICISVDAALRQPGREFSAELTLYIVHGWLHLAGYGDLQPAKKRRMRRAEQKALALLRSAGAMPRFTMSRSSR